MNVVIVEELGGMVSYGKDEIKILKSVFDQVPNDLKDNFKTVIEYSKKYYDELVAAEKYKGNRPNASVLKKRSLSYVYDWLKERNITPGATRVVSTTNPRIPKDNEVTRVVQKQSYFAQSSATNDDIANMFDCFDSESLSDEQQVLDISSESASIDLDDELFEDLNLLDGLDDF